MYLSRSLSRLSFYAFMCLFQMVRCVFGALLAPPKKENFFLFFFVVFASRESRNTTIDSIESIDTQHSHTFVWLACEKHIVRSRRPSSKSRDLFFFREERTRKRRERTHIQKQLLSCSAFPSSLLVRYARERERERKKHARQTPRERILFKRRRRRR